MDSAYHVRIQPTKRFFELKNLSELWEFRELLMALAMRDIKLRYRQTALGVAWVILQPLLASGILAFVFGTVAGVTKPGRSSVFVFVLAGFIGWSLFSAAFSRASQSLLQHSALISKVYFPRIILPASAIVSALLDGALALALFFLLIGLSGAHLGWEIVMAPIWLALLLVLSAPPSPCGFGMCSILPPSLFRFCFTQARLLIRPQRFPKNGVRSFRSIL
jgi:lipopolysaccharide transport system permease protein